MTLSNLSLQSANLTLGAGQIYMRPRDEAASTFTATGATTSSVFFVDATNARILDQKNHFLVLTASAPLATAPLTPSMVDAAPKMISNVPTAGGLRQITVSPPFATAVATGVGALQLLLENMGATQNDGLSLTFQKNTTGIEVDQALDPVAMVTTSRNITLNATLAETTLRNFALALGINSPAPNVNLLNVGLTSPSQREDRFLFESDAPGDFAIRRILIQRGQNVGQGNLIASKTTNGQIQLQIQALADSSVGGGQETMSIWDTN